MIRIPWLLLARTLLLAQAACAHAYPLQNRLGHCSNPAFDTEVASCLRFSVPAIDVDSLRRVQSEVILVDARERREFGVSHIAGAIHLDAARFKTAALDSLSKNQPVVVYCSIGCRSEKAAERLQKLGFTRVSNLYGSIFEWVNRGYPVVDSTGAPTSRLHTFNASWGRWIENEASVKVH